MDRSNVTLSVAVICVGLATAGCIPGEAAEYSFATWQDAVASGQTGNGKWIPSDIPASAVDIRATYAIDSLYTLVAFRVPDASKRHAPQRCKPVPATSVEFTARTSSWWPRSMRNPREAQAGTVYYHCGEGEYFALVSDRGYFWRH
jgi:hypothetical protein